MSHLKTIISSILFSLSAAVTCAGAMSEGTILLAGSVVNAACEVRVLTPGNQQAGKQPYRQSPAFEYSCLRDGRSDRIRDIITDGELSEGRLPQSVGRISYIVLSEQRGEGYLRVDYF
ncbi:hypothetical protein [Morganella psychrotolerans]|uniref:Type 1 fimbrial protein n=1 Tax=Morganella psychrotolerans TaxID=368603 RepID=A0A1B8HF68_9GAMM|nr:hypothetical protein [Morganella psychrotolerans]OBU07704.1 hypothetical protein AYY18_05625 [Morganella psychrotolerans]